MGVWLEEGKFRPDACGWRDIFRSVPVERFSGCGFPGSLVLLVNAMSYAPVTYKVVPLLFRSSASKHEHEYDRLRSNITQYNFLGRERKMARN